jgi:hypothetical protein
MAFEAIHNFYEPLVIKRLADTLDDEWDQFDEALLNDIACLALNRLPPRYVCHSVDFLSHLSMRELEEIHIQVDAAIRQAADIVRNRRKESSR